MGLAEPNSEPLDEGANSGSERLRRKTRDYIVREVEGTCIVAESFARGVADDPALLRCFGGISRLTPNSLLSAVRYRALAGDDFPGAAALREGCYEEGLWRQTWPGTREYLLRCHRALKELASLPIQVNEVSRCASLYPALLDVTERDGGSPLHLVELGASGGLNLLLDRYLYRYPGQVAGFLGSSVQIRVPVVRGALPDLSMTRLEIESRLGVERHPVDLTDAEQVRRLEAQVWPTHFRRLRLLREAVALARESPPDVRRGDMFELTPELVLGASDEAEVCLVHTFVVTHWGSERRRAWRDLLRDLGRQRRIVCVSIEQYAGRDRELHIDEYSGRGHRQRVLGRASGHGHWMEWFR